MLSSRRSNQGYAAIFVALAIAVGVFGACSAVGTNSGSAIGGDGGGSRDSGAGGSDATTDGAGVDTGSAGDGAAPPTTVLFVQASPSLPDVRLCWSFGGVTSPVLPFPGDGHMPGSNYPGVPLGGVAAMSDATPLTGVGMTLYAVDAENLARIEQGQPAPSTCDALICGPGSNLPPSCLRYNLDYWPVATLASSSVKSSKDNVVALSGCLPAALDPNASAALCGATWSAVGGNLHADILQLLTTTSTEPAMAVQAAQLSPALAALEGDGGAAIVSFGPQGAADASPVAALQLEGELSAPTVLSLEGGLAVYGQLGFSVDVLGIDGGAGHVWMSLAESQQLVDPTEDPTQFFGQPRAYLVAVLGDPNSPHAFAPVTGDAGYDGRGLHILVIAAPSPEAGVADAGPAGDAGHAGDAGNAGDAAKLGDAGDAGSGDL